jgi:hypothetical protein
MANANAVRRFLIMRSPEISIFSSSFNSVELPHSAYSLKATIKKISLSTTLAALLESPR